VDTLLLKLEEDPTDMVVDGAVVGVLIEFELAVPIHSVRVMKQLLEILVEREPFLDALGRVVVQEFVEANLACGCLLPFVSGLRFMSIVPGGGRQDGRVGQRLVEKHLGAGSEDLIVRLMGSAAA
jgi:hypothetical protein